MNQSRNKMIDFLGIFTLIIILTFIIVYVYILNNFKYVKDNWVRYKCNPLYAPFAGLFMKDPKARKNLVKSGIKNISSCLWKTSKGFFSLLIKPMMFVINIITSILGRIKDTLDTFRQQLIVIRKMLMQIVKKVMSRLENLVAVFLHTFFKLRDTTKKSLATFKVLTYMLQSTSFTLQSMINGPIGKLAKIAGKYGYLMTYFLLGPISFKMFPSLWLPVFCFSPEFDVKLLDNTLKPISKIKIGDHLYGDGTVTGIYNFLNINKDQSKIQDGIVSNNHIVYDYDRWKLVKDIVEKDTLTESPQILHCLSVNNNIIYGKHNVYRDWDEISNLDLELSFKNKILTSLNKFPYLEWDKKHLYSEGFSFSISDLNCLAKTKLGQKFRGNIIIGKSLRKDHQVVWFKNKKTDIGMYISGSNIVFDSSKKKWIPVYCHPDFVVTSLEKDMVCHIVTLTGNIYLNDYMFKDLLEVRDVNYELYYQHKVLNYLNNH